MSSNLPSLLFGCVSEVKQRNCLPALPVLQVRPGGADDVLPVPDHGHQVAAGAAREEELRDPQPEPGRELYSAAVS